MLDGGPMKTHMCTCANQSSYL